MRFRKRPPFNPSEAVKPICEAIDKLMRSVPAESILETLDEIIAYGEHRFSYVKNLLTKKGKNRRGRK